MDTNSAWVRCSGNDAEKAEGVQAGTATGLLIHKVKPDEIIILVLHSDATDIWPFSMLAAFRACLNMCLYVNEGAMLQTP